MTISSYHALLFIFLSTVLFPPTTGYTVSGNEIRDLESTTETGFAQEVLFWGANTAVTPKYTNCSGTLLLGGYGVLPSPGELLRTYTGLIAHQSVQVIVNVWFIDVWSLTNSVTFYVIKNGTTILSKAISMASSPSWPGNLCGNSAANDLASVTVSAQVAHSDSDISIKVKCSSYNTPIAGHCGIRNVKLILLPTTPSSVSFCGATTPPGLLTSDNCDCTGMGYFDRNSGTCQACDPACFSCTGGTSTDCNSCNLAYFSSGPKACTACHSTCQTCSGPENNKCTSCKNADYLYPNNTCLSACDPPMVIDNSGIKSCKSPCVDSSMYYYPNENVCKSTCTAPDVISFGGAYNICTVATPQTPSNPQNPQNVTSPQTPQSPESPQASPGTLGVIKSTTDSILNIGLIITSIASLGDSFSIIDGTVSRMFQYIKYLNINYSPELEVVLRTWSTSLISVKIAPNAPEALSDESMYDPLPYVFSKYNVSPSYLSNVWNDWLLLIISFSIFVSFYLSGILASHMKKPRPRLIFALNKLKAMTQQFLLILIYTGYGDTVFFSLLEFRATVPGQNLSNLSLCISVVQVLIGLGIIGLQVNLLIKRRKIQGNKKSETSSPESLSSFYKQYEGYLIFFKDFREESTVQQAFLLVFIGRNLLLTLILTTLFEYPLAQTILIVILNIAMLMFLAIKRPFKELVNEIQQLLCELALLIVNIATMSMAILDVEGTEAKKTREDLSYLIIVLNIIFNFAAILFCAITGVLLAKYLYRHIRKNQSKSQNTQPKTISLPQPAQNEELHVATLDHHEPVSPSRAKAKPRVRLESPNNQEKVKKEKEVKIDSAAINDNSNLSATPENSIKTHRKKKSDLSAYLDNVEPYEPNMIETQKDERLKPNNPSRRDCYDPIFDESARGKDSDRSLIPHGCESLVSSETERTFSPAFRRTTTLADHPDSNFRSRHLDNSPLRVDTERHMVRSDTTESATLLNTQRSVNSAFEARLKSMNSMSRQRTLARQLPVVNVEVSPKKTHGGTPSDLIRPQVIPEENNQGASSYASRENNYQQQYIGHMKVNYKDDNNLNSEGVSQMTTKEFAPSAIENLENR